MSIFSSWLSSPPPEAAIEISPGRVAAAALSGRGSGAVVNAYAWDALPAGALTASLASSNVLDRAAVAGAVRSVLDKLGTRPRRVALVIPDLSAKVSLVHFDQLPARREDLEQLVRWQVRKSAPFPIEEASVTFSPAARHADGSSDLVVALARLETIQEYEAVCADAGVEAGLVDLATLSVINLFLASPPAPAGDWLLVHMRPECTSLAIMRNDDLLFYRSRPETEAEALGDRVHQTVMYYQDRLAGQGFARVLLGGTVPATAAVNVARQRLEERLGVAVEAIDPATITPLADRISTSPGLSDVLAPLVGILLRSRREAVAA